jgi:hypothetical protein
VKYLRFAAPLVPFAIAWVIVALKLPPDAQYVGTDVGRELGAWFSTQPFAAPHFVGDGFANAWAVPAGTHTVVFLPQVVRDASVLALPAALAAVAILVLAWSLAARRRRSAA